MSNMSPALRALVLATKHASMPTEADSARVLSGLRLRLGATAVAAISALGPTRPAFLSARAIGICVAGLALVGGLWSLTARNTRETSNLVDASPRAAATSSENVTSASVSPVDNSIAQAATLAEGAAVPIAPDPPKATSPSVNRRSRDGLAAEVELLSRAETALHSGKPKLALSLLREHEHKFANGILKEERIAARVQALCAGGRKAEANTQLILLSSKSLHGDRSRTACGSPP